MRFCSIATTTAALVAATAGISQAATYYLKTTLSAGNDWNATGNYSLTTDGTGASPSGSISGHDLDFFGRSVNTSSNATTFNGSSLTLNGGTLGLRNNGAKTIGNFIAGTGTGTLNFTDSTTASLVVTSFTATTNSLTRLGDLNGSGVSTAITHAVGITTLTGSGDLTVTASSGVNPGGSKVIVLTVTNATNFTGDIDLTQGANLAYLQFGNDAVFGSGGLIATAATSRITLDRNITVASLSLNGNSLSAGTYSYATLNGDPGYDTIFTNGAFSGSITVVPEPATLGLALLAPLFARRRRSGR